VTTVGLDARYPTVCDQCAESLLVMSGDAI
jgi:hypothetical protein